MIAKQGGLRQLPAGGGVTTGAEKPTPPLSLQFQPGVEAGAQGSTEISTLMRGDSLCHHTGRPVTPICKLNSSCSQKEGRVGRKEGREGGREERKRWTLSCLCWRDKPSTLTGYLGLALESAELKT